jgi:hypothetical protein
MHTVPKDTDQSLFKYFAKQYVLVEYPKTLALEQILVDQSSFSLGFSFKKHR